MAVSQQQSHARATRRGGLRPTSPSCRSYCAEKFRLPLAPFHDVAFLGFLRLSVQTFDILLRAFHARSLGSYPFFAEVNFIPAPQIIIGFIKLFGELEADNPNILRDPLHVRTKAIEHAHVIIAPDGEKEVVNLIGIVRFAGRDLTL